MEMATSRTAASKARESKQAQGDLPTQSLHCDPSVTHLHNWLPIPNAFNLTAPPPWWLQMIHDYDNQLVIFPSRRERVYRLARRARRSGGLPGDFPIHHPDSEVMKMHRLVPVSSLPVPLVSSPAIIPQLQDRDMERLGGADKVMEAIERREQAKEERENNYLASEAAARHREARRVYKARSGSMKFMASGVKRQRGHFTPPPASAAGPALVQP